MHVGAASITPPTLQNAERKSDHPSYSLYIAILTFFGKLLESMLIILSTSSSLISNYFFLKSANGLILSIVR